VITIADVLRRAVEVVGERADRRWTRASLTLRGSDGVSREDFFNAFTVAERAKLVTEKINVGVWSPLLQRDVPKGVGRAGTRPICWATCTDTAIIYALTDLIDPYVEARLTKVALAYRRGRRMYDSIVDAVSRSRARALNVVCVLDVKGFYDNLRWSDLDRVIDELPADAQVRALLKALVRVEVRGVEDGSVIQREKGVPQGLPISPILANLAMAAFDRAVATICGKYGCVVRRYADDIILFAPTVEAGNRARDVVRQQLAVLGLEVKDGTAEVVDLALAGTSATWLGVRLRGITHAGSTVIGFDIPEATVAAKAAELRVELAAGLTTRADLDERLTALGRYWAAIVPEHHVRRAIAAIRQGVVPISGKTPCEVLRSVVDDLSMTNRKEKENREKTIDELIYPTKRTPRTLWEERVDVGSMVWGERVDVGTTMRVAFKAERKVERVGKGKEPLPGAGLHGPRRGPVGFHEENARVAVADGGTSSMATPGGGAKSWLSQLSRPNGSRAVSAGRDGGPTSPPPARFRKRILIRAEARGAKAVAIQVERDGVLGASATAQVTDSVSSAEAVMAGFVLAFGALDLAGVTDVVLVSSEPTITGYIEHGWRMGSLQVLRRLRALQRLVQIRMVLETGAGRGAAVRAGVNGGGAPR
jgi:hypothetical protein